MTSKAEKTADISPNTFFTERKKNWFVAILISAWAIAMIFAFWWFQFRNVQAFDLAAVENKTVFFESGKLGSRLENFIKQKNTANDTTKNISIVHFWNPDCPCSRFNQPHVQKIMNDYADKNVRFTVVVSGNNEKERYQHKVKAKEIFNFKAVTDIRSDWPMEQGPPSSPAVAVMNENGKLTYFGPYSLGARCSPDKGRFVEKVLDGLSAKKKRVKKQLNTLAVGCFCPWAKNT